MAITTYAELKTAITSWLEDASGAHTSGLGDFIALGEAMLFRRLRTRAMVATTTGTLSSGTATLALPARFAGLMKLQLTYGGGNVTPSEVSPEKAIERYGFEGNGLPRVYTIEGPNLRFWPTPDNDYAYAMAFRQKPEVLSDGNTSNWLLADAPDAYLYASLVAAGGKLDSPKTAAWATLLAEAVQSLESESTNDSATDQPMVLTSRGTP